MVTLSVFLSTHSKRSATVCFFYCCFKQPIFLSTHSKRSATDRRYFRGVENYISIHALQAECDCSYSLNDRGSSYFYPRTPSGVRPNVIIGCPLASIFLSTHSKRSATIKYLVTRSVMQFLSTHSKRSATSSSTTDRTKNTNFYPRTPSGVRLSICFAPVLTTVFLSTHSKRSATPLLILIDCELKRFLSTHSKRSATLFPSKIRSDFIFLSTHSKRSATELKSKFLSIVRFLSTHSKRSAT